MSQQMAGLGPCLWLLEVTFCEKGDLLCQYCQVHAHKDFSDSFHLTLWDLYIVIWNALTQLLLWIGATLYIGMYSFIHTISTSNNHPHSFKFVK